MIAGAHTILFAEDADAARAFLRYVLGFVGVDAGDGWLIFELPPAEVAVHPGPGSEHSVGRHELFLVCHDIERTVTELKAKGAEFVAPISDEGYGLMTRLKIPGAGEIGLYEPRHPSPLAEFSRVATMPPPPAATNRSSADRDWGWRKVGRLLAMCRNIHTLYNFEPPATKEEVRAAAVQYVRKISGFTKPSRANAEAFERAVDSVAAASERLLSELVTSASPKDREVEAAKARARRAQRQAA